MRTRFIATDYFSESSYEASNNFQPLFLPVPNVCSPDQFNSAEIPLLLPDSSVCHEIDKFPFEDALTDFLSDVIPRFLITEERRSAHCDTGMQFAAISETNLELIGCAECEMDSVESKGGYFYKELEGEKTLKANSGASVDKLLETFILFEIAELEDFPLWELGLSSNGDEARLFLDAHSACFSLNGLDVEMETTIANPYEIDRLLYLIEDVPDICINQEMLSTKSDKSLQDSNLCHAIKSSIFEIGESLMDIHESFPVDETLNDLLDHLKPQINGDEFVVSAKDFLGPTNENLSNLFSIQDISEHAFEHKLPTLTSSLELKVININGVVLLEKQSVIYPVETDESSQHFPCSAQLEEVQIFDGAVSVLDLFNSFDAMEKDEFLEQMCIEEIGHMENFYESVLSSELSITVDPFKFLPAPVLNDDKVLKSSAIMEEIYNVLKPHSFSVCDDIYLDWHPLLEGDCNKESCSKFISMVHEVHDYKPDISELNSQYESCMPSEFDFIDDSLGELSISQCKELIGPLENCLDDVGPAADNTGNEIVNQDIKEDNVTMQKPKRSTAKISSFVDSMSHSNDLNFFLGVRKGSAEMPSGLKASSANRTSENMASGHTIQEPFEASTIFESNNKKIEVHKACLSGYTLSLIDQIQVIYFSNINKCKHLISDRSLSTATQLLSFPKERLLELISEKGGSQCTLGARDEDFVALLAVFAVKHIVYNLCFFGVHNAYLYVSICSHKVDILAESLQPLHSLLQDAHWKAEKQIIESHPSLSIIEELLKNDSEECKKSLIISDEAFWPSLKHKLTTLKLSFHEVRNPCCPAEQLESMDNYRSLNSILEVLSHSDCLLLSYENISASFPFDKFSNILEYGGSHTTARISEIFLNLSNFPLAHFIKLDMDNHYLAKAFCEGFDASKASMVSQKKLPTYMPYLLGCSNDQKTEGLPAQYPLGKAFNNSYDSVCTKESSYDNEHAKNMDHIPGTNKTARACSVPDLVIIVNTQSFGKTTLISRRSSYQKILELEKRGVQVVERDVDLPLDLIFSAAVCLVWYEARSVMKKTKEVVANLPGVPAFIENIATKILMSLSSSFNSCILIFEGESTFLASVMESSDMLYAAAASLDLNLQLFCSYMPETTDDIILNCIKTTCTKDRGLSSVMTESESIAESFLTKFPSLNPLSAHAILSSGGILVEFLEWSQERRIQAIGKYKVPHESISLFNALCKFGELGDSKSVMTDCSSIDSENSGGTLQSRRKRQMYGMSYDTPDKLVCESRYTEPNHLNQSSNLTFHDVPETTNFFHNSNNLERRHEANYFKPRNHGGNSLAKRHSDPQGVFDYNCSFLDEPCASIPRSKFNPRETILQCEPNIKTFLSSSDLSFPTNTELGHSEYDLTNLCQKNKLEKELHEPKNAFFNKELLAKGNSSLHQSFSDPYLGEFIRSNMSLPSPQQYHKNSIMKSLGQTTERSRLRQQSPYSTGNIFPGNLKRMATYQKKSPSSIDSFRYQGRNKQAKGASKKCKGLTATQSNPRALITPTWTPVDKRARQNLSFMRKGNEHQSKLVWRRSDSPQVHCSLRKRTRDDA